MEYKFDHVYFILLPRHPKLFSIVAKSIILFVLGLLSCMVGFLTFSLDKI